MRHPHLSSALYSLVQGARLIRIVNRGLAIFPFVARHHGPAQHRANQLVAVADSQNGNAQLEKLRVDQRGPFGVNGVGAPGKENAFGLWGDIGRLNIVLINLGVKSEFSV